MVVDLGDLVGGVVGAGLGGNEVGNLFYGGAPVACGIVGPCLGLGGGGWARCSPFGEAEACVVGVGDDDVIVLISEWFKLSHLRSMQVLHNLGFQRRC